MLLAIVAAAAAAAAGHYPTATEAIYSRGDSAVQPPTAPTEFVVHTNATKQGRRTGIEIGRGNTCGGGGGGGGRGSKVTVAAGRGGGAYSSVACLSHQTCDHRPVSRRSTAPTPNRGTTGVWAFITFLPHLVYYTRKCLIVLSLSYTGWGPFLPFREFQKEKMTSKN